MPTNFLSIISWLSSLKPEVVCGTGAIAAAMISAISVVIWYWLKIK